LLFLDLLADDLTSNSNPGVTSEPSNGSDFSTFPASARVDAARAHQHHRPSGIERYIREVDQYNAWLGGNQHANPPRIEAKAHYLDNWDRNWKRLDTASNRCAHFRSDGTGTANSGRGPNSGAGSNSGGLSNGRGDPCGEDESYGQGSSYGRESRCGGDSSYDGGNRQDENVSQTGIRSHREASFNGKGNRNGGGNSHHSTSR